MDTDPLFDDGLAVRLTGPEDVLAYLPYRFGFVPTEALAILQVLEAEPGQITLGLAARLDLAELARPSVLRASMTALRDQLARDPSIAALTVLYSDIEPQGVSAGWGVAGRVLRQWLAEFPLADPASTFLVTSTTYRCLQCAEPPCCPTAGRPVVELRDTAVAAQMVLAGRMLVASREDLACPRDASAERAAVAARAAQRERRAMRTRSPEQQRRWRRSVLDRYGRLREQARANPTRWDADPAELGRLSAALTDPDLRDAVVAWSLTGRRLPPGSIAVLEAFGGIVTGGSAIPGTEHLDAAGAVLTEVARHTGPGRGGYPLAVLAWLAWWRGDGARADVLRRQSLDDDPVNTLSRLLEEVLVGGVRPGWALPGPTVATPGR